MCYKQSGKLGCFFELKRKSPVYCTYRMIGLSHQINQPKKERYRLWQCMIGMATETEMIWLTTLLNTRSTKIVQVTAVHQEVLLIHQQVDSEYSCAVEPPVRFEQSHHSR